ncbi:MAG: heme ABC exporter ATP-binding protein CcmA [Candidatus Pacebacteria bacterium]|nr:heme ABC exporter ATP-binding protein CcmA [Candidatus Paceibacterota bacterium]
MIPTLTALHVKNLSLSRGGRRVIESLNCHVKSGEILHLRGKNGSGKTSLLRCIAGLLPADSGVIEWQGMDSDSDELDRRRILLWLGINNGLKAHETIDQHCNFIVRIAAAEASQEDLRQRITAALHRMGLDRLADQPIQKLSTGQRQRLALTALILRPARLWLLDEPSLGLDDSGLSLLSDLLHDFCQSGGMVLMASHQDLPLTLPGRTLEL